jgi:hypothetical protein
MKKRDKTKQAKLEKITTKRALYEKKRRLKFLKSKEAKESTDVSKS